jgi:hypothetical protein
MELKDLISCYGPMNQGASEPIVCGRAVRQKGSRADKQEF